MNLICYYIFLLGIKTLLLYTLTIMAKHLVQLIIAGAQVVGRAFTQAVRQEIRMSQEAAAKSASKQSK